MEDGVDATLTDVAKELARWKAEKFVGVEAIEAAPLPALPVSLLSRSSSLCLIRWERGRA